MEEKGVTKESLYIDFRKAADLLREPKNWMDVQAPAQPVVSALVDLFEASFSQSFVAMGECRRSVPYAPLRPIIDENNAFRWCCTHSEEHCAP